MDAYDRSSAIEQATMTRIAEIYAGALRQALKKKKDFLQKVQDVDSGKIKPPQYYVQRGEVDKWKEGFLRELMRQDAVIDGIMEELNKAGVEASGLIRGSLVEIYRANREETVNAIEEESDGMVVAASFAQYDKNQIRALIEEGQSPFSKLAFRNLGKNPAIRRRLQNELGMATILGESQRKIIERIRKVTGQTVAQARRVAQTERTRVQSQARWQTGQEAAAMGVEIENTWSARMVNTRESHAALDGQKKPQGEAFHTIWGNDLLFPGDPEAPAREVINCHCVLMPHVVMPKPKGAEELVKNAASGIIKKGNKEVRAWYLGQVRSIPDTIDQGLPMVEKALRAFEARNRIRIEARRMMADEAARERLEQERPNKTFEELIKSKMDRKGMTREEAIEDVYKTATKTNENVNKELGLEG